MSKKEWVSVALVLVLGGLYVVFFSGWFGPKVIRVEHTVRSLRDAYGPGGRRVDATGKQPLGNVSFSLHKNYQLTSVKVVAAADARTNKYPHALWQLVSKDGSQPVDALAYGMSVPGMTPASSALEPEPLEPGVEYRLLVEAGAWKGARDFTMPLATRAAR
jgi:hypothetical protein